MPATHFVRAKMDYYWLYSCFSSALDELAIDTRNHSPAVIAGNFNAWAQE